MELTKDIAAELNSNYSATVDVLPLSKKKIHCVSKPLYKKDNKKNEFLLFSLWMAIKSKT